MDESNDHDLVALVRRGYDEYARGPVALVSLFADDIEFHNGGAHRNAGTFRGRETVLGMLLRVRELSGNTISITPRNIIQAGDSMVLALVHVTAARGDRTLDEIAAHLSRWENEQIVEYWTTYQDQDAVDDFWG